MSYFVLFCTCQNSGPFPLPYLFPKTPATSSHSHRLAQAGEFAGHLCWSHEKWRHRLTQLPVFHSPRRGWQDYPIRSFIKHVYLLELIQWWSLMFFSSPLRHPEKFDYPIVWPCGGNSFGTRDGCHCSGEKVCVGSAIVTGPCHPCKLVSVKYSMVGYYPMIIPWLSHEYPTVAFLESYTIVWLFIIKWSSHG